MAITQDTFIALKPDAAARGLMGDIIQRLEKKGLEITAMQMIPKLPKNFVEQHYDDLKSRPFFQDLVKYMTSGPVVFMKVRGTNVIDTVRKMIGATNPDKFVPGTIRGDLSHHGTFNLIHGSDLADTSKAELERVKQYFPHWEGKPVSTKVTPIKTPQPAASPVMARI
jgi:nucleoside-diphosphate kinase